MRTSLLLICLLFGLLCGIAGAAENEPAAAAPDPALGTYKGRLSLNVNGRPKDYEFLAEIQRIDRKNGRVDIRVASDFYTSKEITRNNCKLLPDTPVTAFTCRGEGWHEDYELKDDSIKASCLTKKGYLYNISATKAAK